MQIRLLRLVLSKVLDLNGMVEREPRFLGLTIMMNSSGLSHKFLSTGSLLSLAVGLSACAGVGGTTYGTGESQEMALVNDVTNIVGTTEEQAPIDYSARPGLVLPPKGSSLPSPGKQRSLPQTAANWPQDPDILRRAYHERMASMSDKERKALLEAIRRLPPDQRNAIIKNDPRQTDYANQIKDLDYSKGMPTPGQVKEYDRQVKERLALIRMQREGEKGKRVYLTQPPERFTTLDPKVQAEMKKVTDGSGSEEGKKDNVFKRLWPF